MSNKIYFGPSGNSESFYAQGFKHTFEAPAWIKGLGLNAFEYSFGRGVRLGEETAKKIKDEAIKNEILISVHAPYFINLAIDDQTRITKNYFYFEESAAAAKMLGATRMIFHPGSVTKMTRRQAIELAIPFWKKILERHFSNGFESITLCPETMGKINQLGDLDEVIELCKIDERVIPTIDFGHLNARTHGSIRTIEDYKAILDKLENNLGFERASNMHVHFSKIEYSQGGEVKHLTFSDRQFGPEFEPLAVLLAQRNWTPHIICESSGTMAEDALYMKQCYEKAKEAL